MDLLPKDCHKEILARMSFILHAYALQKHPHTPLGPLRDKWQGFILNLSLKTSTALVLLSEVLWVHKQSVFEITAIRHRFLKRDAWYNCVGLLLEEVIFLSDRAVLITAREIRTTAHYRVKIDLWLFPFTSLPWISLQSNTDHQSQENKPYITEASITEVIS